MQSAGDLDILRVAHARPLPARVPHQLRRQEGEREEVPDCATEALGQSWGIASVRARRQADPQDLQTQGTWLSEGLAEHSGLA